MNERGEKGEGVGQGRKMEGGIREDRGWREGKDGRERGTPLYFT